MQYFVIIFLFDSYRWVEVVLLVLKLIIWEFMYRFTFISISVYFEHTFSANIVVLEFPLITNVSQFLLVLIPGKISIDIVLFFIFCLPYLYNFIVLKSSSRYFKSSTHLLSRNAYYLSNRDVISGFALKIILLKIIISWNYIWNYK